MRLLHARDDPLGAQLLEENPDPTEDEVRHAIAGNLCRCTGYQFIVKSVLEAARPSREAAPASV